MTDDMSWLLTCMYSMFLADLQRRHDGVHQFSFQVCSVPEMSFVVVKRVVQVGDWAVCKHTASTSVWIIPINPVASARSFSSTHHGTCKALPDGPAAFPVTWTQEEAPGNGGWRCQRQAESAGTHCQSRSASTETGAAWEGWLVRRDPQSTASLGISRKKTIKDF